MDSTNPKVSFIPKGSLVRDESFLNRSRPRSLLGVIAGVIFVAAIGAYFGFRYYNGQLNQKIAENTLALENVQKKFSTAPEVSEAKVFLTRANLARELLDTHTVVSPVLDFLSKNTTENIFFSKFSFKNSADGSSLTLAGEAPSYATLAYQSDILRSKTAELQKFSVQDVTLTRAGTITFSFVLIFRPSYLLYTKQFAVVAPVTEMPSPQNPDMPPAPSSPQNTTEPTSATQAPVGGAGASSSSTPPSTSSTTFPSTTSTPAAVPVAPAHQAGIVQ